MSEVISLIQAVEAIEAIKEAAKKRIPARLRGKITFFSDYDLWRYVAVMDDRTCLACIEHEHALYQGSHIRLIFPYLEIVNEFTIRPHVHPNCRCILFRTG